MSIKRLRQAGLVNTPAFSHVAVIPPGAKTTYVGGQNSVDADGALIGRDDVAAQSIRALENVKAALPLRKPLSTMSCSGRCCSLMVSMSARRIGPLRLSSPAMSRHS